MHRTPAGDRRPSGDPPGSRPGMPAPCKKAASAPEARREAERLQGEAEKALAEAEALKLLSILKSSSMTSALWWKSLAAAWLRP